MTTTQNANILRAFSLARTLAAATLTDNIGDELDAVHAHNVSLAIVESLTRAIEG